jgi:hypothetical protein
MVIISTLIALFKLHLDYLAQSSLLITKTKLDGLLEILLDPLFIRTRKTGTVTHLTLLCLLCRKRWASSFISSCHFACAQASKVISTMRVGIFVKQWPIIAADTLYAAEQLEDKKDKVKSACSTVQFNHAPPSCNCNGWLYEFAQIPAHRLSRCQDVRHQHTPTYVSPGC